MAGQPPVPVAEPPVQVTDIRLWHLLRLRHGVAELAGDAYPVLGALVDIEHDLAETGALEPGQHGVDCRSLLGDEQHLAAAGDEGGDEVRDGLALASARRTVNDQAAA